MMKVCGLTKMRILNSLHNLIGDLQKFQQQAPQRGNFAIEVPDVFGLLIPLIPRRSDGLLEHVILSFCPCSEIVCIVSLSISFALKYR